MLPPIACLFGWFFSFSFSFSFSSSSSFSFPFPFLVQYDIEIENVLVLRSKNGIKVRIEVRFRQLAFIGDLACFASASPWLFCFIAHAGTLLFVALQQQRVGEH